MKIVSQLDDAGFFLGTVIADESPLEPGVFLVPGGCVDAPAPDIPAGQRARWNSGWVLEIIPHPGPEAEELNTPVIPQQVSRAQGKAVLIQMGLWSQVLAFVAAIPDDTQRALAEVALNDTQFWQRNSPFLSQAATALGITQEQMDNLFRQAAGVVL